MPEMFENEIDLILIDILNMTEYYPDRPIRKWKIGYSIDLSELSSFSDNSVFLIYKINQIGKLRVLFRGICFVFGFFYDENKMLSHGSSLKYLYWVCLP